jgi:hypothetical protein
MKFSFCYSCFNLRNKHFSLISIIGLLTVHPLKSQDIQKPELDYLMQKKGSSTIGLYSGIPYVGITEYSYGISRHFALGVLYGYTPVVVGYGLRIKVLIAEPDENRRVYLKSPILYYPKTNELGGDPWILAWPNINVEWKMKNGARFWSGLGLVGAACVDYLFGIKDNETTTANDHQGNVTMAKKGIMADLWNTIQVGYSKPVSKKMTFMAEVAPVMKGLKLSSSNQWIGGPPVILTFGLSYSL